MIMREHVTQSSRATHCGVLIAFETNGALWLQGMRHMHTKCLLTDTVFGGLGLYVEFYITTLRLKDFCFRKAQHTRFLLLLRKS